MSNDTSSANRAADTGMKGKMDSISSNQFDWSFIPDKNAGEKQLIGLAGGLTPENIKEALPLFHQNIIDFVDVSSGTEAAGVLQVKGQKSSERMHAFMQEIRI